jgi:hypothetical protein
MWLGVCLLSDEEALDYVCEVLHANRSLLLHTVPLTDQRERNGFYEALVVANTVAHRANMEQGKEWPVLGERADRRAKLRFELPGFVGERAWGDADIFDALALTIYNHADEIMRLVIPATGLRNAARLAEVLVICEQACDRAGYATELDGKPEDHDTTARRLAAELRERVLAFDLALEVN